MNLSLSKDQIQIFYSFIAKGPLKEVILVQVELLAMKLGKSEGRGQIRQLWFH